MQHDAVLAPGATFEGRYEIVAKLGEGGFGAVHKARQLSTGQLVALKILRVADHGDAARTDARIARFLREARVCAQLLHPNIVQLVDTGQMADGTLYIAFAFVPGQNLAALLESEGALAPREARHLMLQVLDALACAHAEGVVHRDLKPSNIMVIPTGARRNALVLDFGISAMLDRERAPRVTGTHDALGTPGYGAPEQWRGVDPAPRADLFSWGLVFLECLTGAPVYTGTAAEIFYKVLAPDPVPMPAALARHPLGELIAGAVRKEPAQREATARDLLDALDTCELRGLSREAMLGGSAARVGSSSAPSIAAAGAGLGAGSGVALGAALGTAPGAARGAALGVAPTTVSGRRAAPAALGERRQLTALCCRVHVRSSARSQAQAPSATPGDPRTAAASDSDPHMGERAGHAGRSDSSGDPRGNTASDTPGDPRRITASDSSGDPRMNTASDMPGDPRGPAASDLAGDALDDALRSAIARCAEIGQRHGGWAAAALGDELLIYFGYPRASEDDARHAARAAHAITAAGGAASPAVGGVRVEVGIGLHCGLAVDGGPGTLDGAGPTTGATPRLAARLAALAPPGATIVSAAARRLLRTGFDLAPDGAHAIDGAAPVEVFRLGDERREPDSTTFDGVRTPIAGREPELALLIERWRRACEGAGQSSLITGEAGIGKSRLARELRDRVAREPHSFLDLRCSPDTRNSALAAVIELLERALGLDRERDARGRIARLEAELARHGATPADAMPLFLPLFALPIESPYRPVEASPQRQRALTLDAIVALLFAIAERAPVLLHAEDLHWADPTTIELVTRLVREAPDGPLCLIMTARPEFSPAFSTAGVLMLPLTRLGRPQIEQMVGALLRDKALPPAAVEHIANRADGVPLFVEELLHMMIDTGVLVERADRYELGGSLSDARIPGTLRALLTARLDRLSRARETAQLAAALGREFSLDVLAAASPEDPAVIAEDVERLIHAGLVLRKRRGKDAVGVFKHALLRDAAYDSLATGARHDAHARIATVLEERFPELARTRPDLLAHHHAAADHKPRAVVYAQRAAEHGLQRSMYAEAIAHASNAIAWADALRGADGIEAELSANGALIQALMATRGWADPQVKAAADRSARLLDQLEPDSKHRVPTLWFLFTYHHVASNRRTARGVAEQLVAIAERSGDAGFAAAAAMLHGLALFIDGDHAAARPVFERAVALYDPALHRDHGARFGLDSLVLARAFLAHLRWFAGEASAAFALVASAIAWARELGHVPSIALGLLYGCTIHQRAGDRSAVAAMAGEILALSARYGLPAYEGYAAMLHAWATGDDERARAIVGALSGLGCKLALSYYGSLVADSQAARGELDAAISCVDHCLSLCRDNDEHFYEPELHRRRALYEARRDPSAEGVRTSLEQAARLARHQDMPRIEVLATLDLVRRFGGIEQRRARLDELLALHPGLRDLDNDPHDGGDRWAWTN